jgi:hypothetical protein
VGDEEDAEVPGVGHDGEEPPKELVSGGDEEDAEAAKELARADGADEAAEESAGGDGDDDTDDDDTDEVVQDTYTDDDDDDDPDYASQPTTPARATCTHPASSYTVVETKVVILTKKMYQYVLNEKDKIAAGEIWFNKSKRIVRCRDLGMVFERAFAQAGGYATWLSQMIDDSDVEFTLCAIVGVISWNKLIDAQLKDRPYISQ